MSKKEQAVAEVSKPVITINPIAVKFQVIGDLRQDGKFRENVTVDGNIPEIAFNHGTTIMDLVQRAQETWDKSLTK